MLPLLLATLNSGVRVEGAPAEPPAELVQSLTPYLSYRSASVADIAPDGQSLLVSTRFGETSQLHRVDAPMGARQQLTFNA